MTDAVPAPVAGAQFQVKAVLSSHAIVLPPFSLECMIMYVNIKLTIRQDRMLVKIIMTNKINNSSGVKFL